MIRFAVVFGLLVFWYLHDGERAVASHADVFRGGRFLGDG